jgi:hypothetical protein
MQRGVHLSRPLENVGASNGNHKLAPVSQKYGVHGKTETPDRPGAHERKCPSIRVKALSRGIQTVHGADN